MRASLQRSGCPFPAFPGLGAWAGWISLGLLLGLLPMEGHAQLPPGAEAELVEKVRLYLRGGELETALEAATQGREGAADPKTRADFSFYRGLAYQELAREDPQRGPAYLEAAMAAYLEYLEAKPESGAGLNNLAQVLQELGRMEEAESFYRRAVARGGARSPLYRKNYAEFLDRRGDWQRATEQYIELLAEAPRSPSLHQRMMDRFLEHGGPSGSLLEYLWRILEGGQPARALQGALQVLGQRPDWPEGLRRQLLTVVVVGLARRPQEPKGFLASPTGKALFPLGGDPELGGGIKEIFLLHLGMVFGPRHYSWWSTPGSGEAYDRDPELGVWPADGFRELVLALGDGYREGEDPRRAESYYRLAAELDPSDLDPAAVGKLVKLYLEEDRLDRVEAVSDQYAQRLMDGKNLAYSARASRREEILQYHLTLGQLYATLGQWGERYEVQGATFQIERALETSRELVEENPERAADPALEVPVVLVESLATNLQSRGKLDRSMAVRLNAIDLYERQGDREAAAEVLEPVRSAEPPAELSPTHRRRLQELQRVYPSAQETALAPQASGPAAPEPTVNPVESGHQLPVVQPPTAQMQEIQMQEIQMQEAQMEGGPTAEEAGEPGGPPGIRLPSGLRCQPAREVVSRLKELGLVPVLAGEGDHVMATSPAEGAALEPGDPVRLALGDREHCP